MASFSWTLVVVLLLLYLSLSNATTCTEPYSCESTCYRYSAYKAVCGTSECYKSRLEPYICNETCYKKVCCQGYTGDDCQTHCGDPGKYVAHGRYVVLQGTTFGNQAVLQCDDGYGSAKLASISCLETGAWSDSTEAMCTRVFPAVQTACGTDICTDPLSYCNPILKKCKCVEGYNMNDDGICEKGCPSDDWVQFGDNCYYFGKVELQYQQARNFCDLYDSDVQESSLVQVDTVEELKFLKSYMLSRSIVPIYGYWNDVFQNTTNGVDEYWRTSGDPLVVTDWGPSEPNKQDEFCTVFYKPYDYKWADYPWANSEQPSVINDNLPLTAFAVCETKIGSSLI